MRIPDEPAIEAMGICPGCDLPGTVRAPCPERACVRRGLHAIPLTFGIDLPPERDPNLGRFIDDMLLVAVLGVGGFGRVYRALGPDGDVAVKLAATTARGGPDPIAADRLQREAKVLAAIDHPNVVELYGAGVADGVPYLVLEHIADAVSLEELITKRAGRFDAETIATLLGQILDALHAAHARGIIHRDIKPENVLVRADLSVRVLDFGLAQTERAASDRPRSATVGTPTHMAPEQMTNTDIGPWTDFYGVGIIAFELMTGRLPFRGRTASAVLRERADPRRDVLDGAPHLPEAVLDFLAMALAESPRDRFQSASGMRAALEDALEGWDDWDFERAPAPEPKPPSDLRATIIESGAVEYDAFVDGFGSFDGDGDVGSRESSILTRARGGALTLMQLAPLALAAVLTLIVLGGRAPGVWATLPLGLVQPQLAVAALREPTPEPPPEPVPAIDPVHEAQKDLVARARRGALGATELEAFASACRPELGCRAVLPEGDLARGLTLPVGKDEGTIVLAFAPDASRAADTCGARFRRSRAIVAGAWDQIDAAWGGYVQPRVVIEAKAGRDVFARRVVLERTTTREALDAGRAALDAGFVVSLDAAELGAPLRAIEELRFQAVEGRFGEEGRYPCRLATPRVYVVAPPLGAIDP